MSLSKAITLIIGAMLMVQGAVLIAFPRSGGPTALSAFIDVFGGSTTAAGVFLIITFCFTLAAAARAFAPFVLVQVGVSLVYAAGAISAVWRGSYPDGYTPAGEGAFIFNDQITVIALLLIHAIAATLQFTE